MIRFIAALDKRLGLASEHGIPWQGLLPTEVAYYRHKIANSTVLMGYGTYLEYRKAPPNRHVMVATTKTAALRPGFKKVNDARAFLKTVKHDLWVEGGSKLFASTLDLADELYLTRIDHDFHCTKFFPPFQKQFKLKSKGQINQENGLTFWFEVWQKR